MASDLINSKKEELPLREFSIIVTNEGYYPKNLVVFQGEKVKFYLTTTQDRPSCLTLSEKNIFMVAKRGEMTEGLTSFEEMGDFQFYCPAGNIKGSLKVIERPEVTQNRKREMASRRVIQEVWMPRED